MDLRLSEEEKLLRNTAAQFVEKELLQLEGSFLKQEQPFLPPGDPPRRDLDPGLRKTLVEKAREIGLWALELPEELGGAGLSHVARVLIHCEFGKTVVPFELPPIPPVVGRSSYGAKIAEGELQLALAFHEIHRTGELSEIHARYRASPGGYCLNASAIDVISFGWDLILLPAKEELSGRIGLFLVDRKTPGCAITEEWDLTSDQGVARIALSDCQLPGDRLLGQEEEVRKIIAGEQLRISARSLGIGTRCLEASLEHARNRVTFGRPLSSRQAIQWMVADLSINLRTATWLTLEAAWKADQGLPFFDAAALAKKKAARMAFEAADTAIQIHGGYGVCKEFPFEAFYREARLMRLLYGQEGEIDRAIAKTELAGL
jgi:acyl-CoA dehydrogenase